MDRLWISNIRTPPPRTQNAVLRFVRARPFAELLLHIRLRGWLRHVSVHAASHHWALLRDKCRFHSGLRIETAARASVDNLLRPYLISSATRVPILLVMLGALGGLAAFGLVGVFIGPVILAVASAIWREWATESS